MPAIHARLLPLASAIVMFAAAEPSVAQTTINLTTANGNCVAVTDQAGLTTAPGGTELRANGVTLTAAQPGACNPAGGSSSTFQASVQISGSATPGTPYTPAINAPFYVIWSASSDATTCVRGGNFTGGISGWTVGSLTGSGSHVEQVTPTAAGSYAFSVTCTNASGYALTSAVNVPQPPTPAPTPNPITLTVPATATAGVPFAVTWPTMSNATRCVGTGTLDGATVANLGDWTTLTTVTTSRNVTVPTGSTGSLALTLTCWNTDNSASAVGTSTAITVSAGSSGACGPIPAEKAYGYARTYVSSVPEVVYGAVPNGKRTNWPTTTWTSIWGYASATQPAPYAWPGVGGDVTLRQFPRSGYIGAKFTTPPAGQAGSMQGWFLSSSSAINPNLIMAISTACGDFSDHLPSPGCKIDARPGDPAGTGVPSSDGQMVGWKFTTNNPTGACNLLPNTDYYVNIMYADPTSTTGCLAGASTCALTTGTSSNVTPTQ
ncbi:MAG: hypothetical protein GXC76_03910 [Rhodanobacteraceae bacterium]|jgi:hypothetical protein|nr:hypothetical protein [Rhodanobacteraceae bacterium]